jgi:hypothetical protein
MDRLSPRWRVLAPDLYGYGKEAPRDRLPSFELDDERDWLQPVFERAGSPFRWSVTPTAAWLHCGPRCAGRSA